MYCISHDFVIMEHCDSIMYGVSHNFLICPTVDGPLGWFHSWPPVNFSAMNIDLHILLYFSGFKALGKIPSSGINGS